MLQVGSVAPDFAITNHRGEMIRSAELRGRPFLLWFYPKADTPGCALEGRGFRDNYESYRAKELQVFGVSFDSEEENRAFADKFDFPFDLLCDIDRELGIMYGACDDPDEGYAKRTSVLVDGDGFVAKIYEKVDPASHPGAVLKDLDSL